MRPVHTTVIREKGYACKVIIAESGFQRLRGLLFRPNWKGGLLMRANSVHTFGMTAPIDVFFLDQKGKILRIVSHLRPWRMSPIVWKAKWVLEVPPGRFRRLQVGYTIQLHHLSKGGVKRV